VTSVEATRSAGQPAAPSRVERTPDAARGDANDEAKAAREILLEVDGISAGYGETVVLRDVSFVVRQGAIVALLGPNGCGKTTLLRIIGKLHVPTAGVVRVIGRDVAAMSQLDLSRVLATVSQVHQTSFPFSVLDILLTGRMPYISVLASPKAADVAFCREVLELFGIGHLETKAITKLSGASGAGDDRARHRTGATRPVARRAHGPTWTCATRYASRRTIARLARSHGPDRAHDHPRPEPGPCLRDRGAVCGKLGALEGARKQATDRAADTNTVRAGSQPRC